MKIRSCRVCRAEFQPVKPLQKVCGYACALTLAAADRAKAEKCAIVKDRKATKEALGRLKSRATWAREAQAAFNAWIRLRDADLPCISCGRHHQGQWHAGHYRSVGAAPELRFVEMNVHKQCSPCNTHLSGNAVKYRAGLIARVGAEVVKALEGPHVIRTHSIDELKGIKAEYTRRVREIRKATA